MPLSKQYNNAALLLVLQVMIRPLQKSSRKSQGGLSLTRRQSKETKDQSAYDSRREGYRELGPRAPEAVEKKKWDQFNSIRTLS